MASIKVGVVEDELIIAAGIIKTLKELGYTPTEPAISYTDALEMIERERPDILLLDIVLSGNKDGIDLAWKIKEDYSIPFIFLTANSDAATVERAKKVCPPAYLVKPFNKDELYTSIEICLYNFSAHTSNKTPEDKGNYIINDCLFVKQTNNFVKVMLEDITYLESDRVYVTVHTVNNKYLVRNTLQNYMELIGAKNFVRVHRSYVINVHHLTSINTDGITVAGQTIPIGKTYREALLSALRLG
ncbi:MAG: pdtaR [Flavipsychrobacter sp.]|jgi:DNA-binding LytR/AlgR family response regulator|nr:pdtaR [Flavipsychrobacter sp.]